MLIYTTQFVFLEQLKVRTNAQKTRMGYNGYSNIFRSLEFLASNLFFKSLDKSEQLQYSPDSRGYDGSCQGIILNELYYSIIF
ncbi:hypothetical protein ALNOE001_17670 [Candidatus Methanobinarius endosymbioticus]|uniref:Uncharacterized protein n=1 Tax=Candidatus Methanobinarius endosymbioticus TaxID=2006182 RepID=A0A366MAB8_9EURY|nr:hypothetical protein ALNOE001_17670 [Candidatus Methanobinarius endosymbioticus]